MADGGAAPIILLDLHHDRKELDTLYRAADICLVTSLDDGMNLVAKEFVAARQDEQRVLVLSRHTWAAPELKEALIVNPVPSRGGRESAAPEFEHVSSRAEAAHAGFPSNGGGRQCAPMGCSYDA